MHVSGVMYIIAPKKASMLKNGAPHDQRLKSQTTQTKNSTIDVSLS